MEAPKTADESPRAAAKEVRARAPSPHSSTSQAFHPALDPVLVKRSLIISAIGSTVGMIMFGLVQGTVINFFLEDLSLKDRIPWFTGLLYLAGIGSVVGSWIQERWGHRRALMIYCCGLSRLTWLVMGLLPLLWPEKIKTGGLFGYISAGVIVFYFVHSIGANAWLTWMSDLVPPEYQSKFWSLRQVATQVSGAAARLGVGYYLREHDREMNAYALIFALATVAGLLDVSSYFFVAHREPKLHPSRRSILAESLKRLKDSPFRKLCGIYLTWLAANCLMGTTVFYFLTEHVGMDVYQLSQCMTISFAGFAISSLFWGRFASQEGHRRAVIACLILQNSCTILYWLCGNGSYMLATVASTLEQIGLGGVTLFMFPMLIDYTKGKGGGRAVGMAAFTGLLSIVGFGACLIGDRHIYNWLAHGFNSAHATTSYTPQSVGVYLAVMVIAFALRFAAIIFAFLLPPCERQLAAGSATLILRRMSEGPLRAMQNILGAAASRLGSDEEEVDELEEK